MERDRTSTKWHCARGWLGLGAALLAAACAPAAADPEPARHPTIVSLNPCLDAILVELAGPEQVRALSHYSRDPGSSSIPAEVAARYGVTGGTAEEVIALKPDLVLASVYLPQPTRIALTRAGLKVATFTSPTSIAESVEQVREVAALTGQGAAGEALATRIGAAPQSTLPPVSALLWQPGEIVAGQATLIAELLRAEGFTSHAEANGLGQADRVSLEWIIKHRPAALLIAGDSEGQRHPLMKYAWKRMVIADFDPALIYCGGPTIPMARARLRAIRQQVEQMP